MKQQILFPFSKSRRLPFDGGLAVMADDPDKGSDDDSDNTNLGIATKTRAKTQKQKFACDFPDSAIIIPVPLHRSRLWARGFNQSVLIGRELARGTGIEMNYNLISRCKITPPLRGMNSAQRAKIVASAFQLSTDADKQLAGKSVLLVDDVYTSGSTSNACARLLKKAGALNIFVFCWARVIKDFEAS